MVYRINGIIFSSTQIKVIKGRSKAQYYNGRVANCINVVEIYKQILSRTVGLYKFPKLFSCMS